MSDKHQNSILRPTRRQTLTMMGLVGASGLVMPGIFGRDKAYAAPPSAPKGQVIIGFSQEPTVFNPHMLHIEVDEGIHFSVFDPLFNVDPEGKFTPALAAEVPSVENGGISADGLNWKVKLRDGVKWHDGKPFTAEDVKFTLELVVDPNFRSGRRAGHDLVRDLKVVSPTEITWRMDKPYAPYPSILAATFIVPKHILEPEADRNAAPFNNAPVGTGPFKWVERVAGDHIELAANTDYYGDGPYLERLIYKYIPDLTVLYTQFKTGDIDVTGLQWITPDHYDEAKALEGKDVVVVPGATVESVTFNMERPQFKDIAVRQALFRHAMCTRPLVKSKCSKASTLMLRRVRLSSFIGPSGSGKSTFLRCINQLESHRRRRDLVDGELTGYAASMATRCIKFDRVNRQCSGGRSAWCSSDSTCFRT